METKYAPIFSLSDNGIRIQKILRDLGYEPKVPPYIDPETGEDCPLCPECFDANQLNKTYTKDHWCQCLNCGNIFDPMLTGEWVKEKTNG